jgi:hypothetical protein
MMDQASIFEKIAHSKTGIDQEANESILVYPFDQYNVKITLDAEGRFLGIAGITVTRKFLSTMQQMRKLRSIGYADLSHKYPDAPENEDLLE